MSIIYNKIYVLNERKYKEIIFFLKNVEILYPDLRKWFDEKVVFGLMNKKRIIYTVENEINEIIGILILKNDIEKKICTLYVNEKYRGLNIGNTLFLISFIELKDKFPVFSVSSEVIQYYNVFIEKYKFVLYKVYKDCYKKGNDEYVYNGYL